MTLQEAFIAQSLQELDRVASELEKYLAVSVDQLQGNLSLRWTVERGLLAGLGLVFQVADHILSSHFHSTPESYQQLLTELRGHGVIGREAHEQLKGAGGFRNVLVHEYIKVDLNEVARMIPLAPGAFRCFSRDVLSWLEGQNS